MIWKLLAYSFTPQLFRRMAGGHWEKWREWYGWQWFLVARCIHKGGKPPQGLLVKSRECEEW